MTPAVTDLAHCDLEELQRYRALLFPTSGALSEPLVRGDGEWWRLFSAMLLHGGWLHLIFNVGGLWILGGAD